MTPSDSRGGGDIVLGDWLVRPRLNRLELRGRSVHLEPKQMDLLVVLAEQAGEVVSKEELLDRVWQGRFVTESVLTRSIAELRRALDDDSRAPRFIETIPKRGYRLVAPVSSAPRERPGGRRRLGRSAPWIGLAVTLLIVLALWRASREGLEIASTPATEPTASQLTTHPGHEVFPSFSPAGHAIAFASDRSGSFEIYVRQLSLEGRDHQLTDDGQINLQPAWSPDNALIAYHSVLRGGIWLVPFLGGEPKQLSEFGSRPTWLPDSQTILFQSDSLRELEPGGDIALPPSTLWSVDVDSAELRQLTRPGTPPGGHGNATVSPDGEWVAFTGSFLQSGRLWRLPLAGGEPRSIQPQGWYRSPVFAPDGDSLYYGGRADGERWILQVGLDGDPKARRLARLPGAHLAISPDGNVLAFSRFTTESNLWSIPVRPEGGDPASEPVPITRSTGRRNTAPVFSPDGSRVAYMARRIGLPFEIWMADLDSGDAVQLTRIGDSPGWSPDGGSVHFRDSNQDGAWYRIGVESRRVTRVGSGGAGRQARRLSPDTHRVAFHRTTEGIANVWVADIATGEETQITFDREFAGFPIWSPDGSEIAFEIRRGSSFQIAVTSAAGGDWIQLTSGPGESWPSSWSPDGERIAFAGRRNGVWNIYWVARDGSDVRQLTHYEGRFGRMIIGANWSPTGDRIAFELRRMTSDLWLVQLD